MKKSIFIVFIFAILLVSFASAYQEKMTVKECLYSLDDPSFQNYWNENTQTGIFLNLTNTNLVLSNTSNPVWVKTSYTPVRKYFNNFESTNQDSFIPIIQVRQDKENIVYVKCKFKVGNYRVFPGEYTPLYIQGTNEGLRLTSDFNLTQGLINKNSWQYLKTSGSSYTYYNNVYNPISFSRDRYQHQVYSATYYIDNKVDPIYENSQINPDSFGLLSTLQTRGLYPNTEPIIGAKINLTKFASGALYSISVIRENGYQYFFNTYDLFFYINSSTQNIADMIVPDYENVTITNENTGQTLDLNAGSSEQCSKELSAPASKKCMLISAGDRLKINFTVKNNFNIALNHVNTRYGYYSDVMWGGGAGYQTSSPGSLDLGYAFDYSQDYINLPQSESKSLIREVTVPSGKAMYYILSTLTFSRDNINSGGRTSLNTIGSDNVTYLGFMRYDPRIELIRQGDLFNPAFKLIVNLYIFDNWASTESMLPGDYSLRAELINSSGAVVGSQVNLLNETEFMKMSPPSVNDFIIDAPPHKNAGGSELGYERTYEMLFPILPEYYLNSQSNLRAQLYSIKNTGEFAGKKIAKLIIVPNFEPGDLIYSVKNRLDFGNESKIDSGKVFVFNPTFYNTTVELRLKWSDENNFMFKWDGESFQKNPVKRIFLKALQRIELSFYVNATHKPWINSPRLENLEMTANATLYKSETEKILKTSRLNFVLNLTTQNLRWFNLNPTSYSPNEIKVDVLNPSKNQAILVNWTTEGTDLILPDYSGKTYLVNLTLKDSEGNILNKTSQIFTITQLWKRETLGISYNFSVGAYSVFFDLDSKNEIIEKNETENNRIYPVNVIFSGCEYNATEHKVYIRNSFGNLIPDTGCNCECEEPSLTCEIGTGLCRNPSSDCSGFSLTNTCNDAPSPFWCAWNCTSATCPPGNNRNGDCKNCDSFGAILGCSGYNNNDTCIKDSCNRKEDHCNNIKNSGGSCSGTYYCTWTTSNRCELFVDSDGPGPGGSCTWRATTIQDCTGNNEFLIVNNSGSPSRCGSYEQKYPCGQILEVPFFTFFNLFSVLVLIVVFYVYKKHY